MSAFCCTENRPNGDSSADSLLPDSGGAPSPCSVEAMDGSRAGSGARGCRVRRFPRVLDHLHVAELLSELFVDALNHPDAIDTKRLQALTSLARTLLQAVGVPKNEPLAHRDRAEPPPFDDCLLRIYPPLDPDTEAQLDFEQCAPAEPSQPVPQAAGPLAPPQPPPGSPDSPIAHPLSSSTQRLSSHPEPNVEQDPEQAMNRSRTGQPDVEAHPGLPLAAPTAGSLAVAAAGVPPAHQPSTALPLAPPAATPLHPAPSPEPTLIAEAAALLAELDPFLSRTTSAAVAQCLDRWKTIPGTQPILPRLPRLAAGLSQSDR